MELIFATANNHKLKEASEILGAQFTLKTPAHFGDLKDIPETGNTIEANSQIKAETLWERFQLPCFADDTGLIVNSLNGEPGVFSARYAGPQGNSLENIKLLLSKLDCKSDRRACFTTVITLILSANEKHTFTGTLKGTIAKIESGKGGFGYDPIFIPEGYHLTLAELSSAEKNKISHRGIALRELSHFLNSITGR